MLTRVKLLCALSENPRATLSGTAIAKRLGITRAAIWKTISELEGQGYPVERRGRKGYGLAPDFDLSLFRLAQSPTSFSGYRIHYQPVTRSTQALAKEAALVHAPEGSLWVTEAQSGGRGRLDRWWSSEWGGLWFSLLLRPPVPPAGIPALTLVAALALCLTVRELTGIDAKLKWPNDITVKSSKGPWKKLAGILTEMAGDMDRSHWVVVGVGLNVQNGLPRSLKSKSTTLRDLTGRSWSRGDLLERFLTRFADDRRRFARAGFGVFRRAYWQTYGRPDEPLTLKTSQGAVRGRARGVDAHGRIIIESRRQMRHFSEGEIVL